MRHSWVPNQFQRSENIWDWLYCFLSRSTAWSLTDVHTWRDQNLTFLFERGFGLRGLRWRHLKKGRLISIGNLWLCLQVQNWKLPEGEIIWYLKGKMFCFFPSYFCIKMWLLSIVIFISQWSLTKWFWAANLNHFEKNTFREKTIFSFFYPCQKNAISYLVYKGFIAICLMLATRFSAEICFSKFFTTVAVLGIGFTLAHTTPSKRIKKIVKNWQLLEKQQCAPKICFSAFRI